MRVIYCCRFIRSLIGCYTNRMAKLLDDVSRAVFWQLKGGNMYNNEVINFTRVNLITFNERIYQFNLLTMTNPSLMDMTEEDAAEGSATGCRRLFAGQHWNVKKTSLRTITIKNLYSHGFLDFRKHIACIYKKWQKLRSRGIDRWEWNLCVGSCMPIM